MEATNTQSYPAAGACASARMVCGVVRHMCIPRQKCRVIRRVAAGNTATRAVSESLSVVYSACVQCQGSKVTMLPQCPVLEIHSGKRCLVCLRPGKV